MNVIVSQVSTANALGTMLQWKTKEGGRTLLIDMGSSRLRVTGPHTSSWPNDLCPIMRNWIGLLWLVVRLLLHFLTLWVDAKVGDSHNGIFGCPLRGAGLGTAQVADCRNFA